jgi:hypothetical protein
MMKTNDFDISEDQQELATDIVKQSAQRELAAGVLKQAAQDLRRFRGATSKVEREIYMDAHRWLTINECASPFSFLNVCQFLGVVPEQVREDLMGDASRDAFSYWIRRCRRAAGRLQKSVSRLFLDDRNGDIEPGDMLFHNAPSPVGAFAHENGN